MGTEDTLDALQGFEKRYAKAEVDVLRLTTTISTTSGDTKSTLTTFWLKVSLSCLRFQEA